MATLHRARIGLVLDIGANAGQYGHRLRALGYRGRIASFEPLEDEHRTLTRHAQRDPFWEVAPRCAIGAEDGMIEMHVSRNSNSSSALAMLPLHREAAPASEITHSVRVPVRTLDAAAKPFVRRGEAVLVKVDVQGMEHRVIAGGRETLAQAAAVQIELSLAPLYAGQPLFWEVAKLVKTEGFELADLNPEFIDPRDGRVLQVDAVFLRRECAANDAV